MLYWAQESIPSGSASHCLCSYHFVQMRITLYVGWCTWGVSNCGRVGIAMIIISSQLLPAPTDYDHTPIMKWVVIREEPHSCKSTTFTITDCYCHRPVGSDKDNSAAIAYSHTLAYTQILIVRMVALTLTPHRRTPSQHRQDVHKILVPIPEFVT